MMQVSDRERDFSVARGMAESFRLHVGGGTVEDTMGQVCRLARDFIAHSEGAAICLAERSGIRSVGATSEAVRHIEEMWARVGEGPVPDVIAGAGRIVVTDMSTDRRWPRLAAAVAGGTPLRAAMVLRLATDGHTLGSLDLYSTRPAAFDSDPARFELALLFATQTSIALRAAQEAENLRAALASREVISVAMGIIMGRQNVSREEAFEILRRASQRENRKVRDIAARLAGPPPVQ